jgi:hypothetical protein
MMMRALLIAALTLAWLSVPVAPPARAAQKTVCTKTLGGAIDGNVVVPAGAECTLDGAQVSGNVKVKRGGTLTATATSVNGSLKATRAAAVSLSENTGIGQSLRISGNFIVQDAAIGEGAVLSRNRQPGGGIFVGNLVGRDLRVTRNAQPIQVSDNLVGDSLLVVRNKNGPIEVTDNGIGEDLICKRNSPPVQESANTVGNQNRCTG